MAANIHHSSETVEWYTPEWLVEKARSILGEIDLDPCSCEDAQKIIKAKIWYNEAQDGLTQKWSGRVFMNPPGGWVSPEIAKKWGSRSSAQCWYNKHFSEFESGSVTAGIVLCFNLDTLRAIQPKLPICILSKRVKFDRIIDGKRVPGNSPAHGTGLILVSHDQELIKSWETIMSDVGTCYKFQK